MIRTIAIQELKTVLREPRYKVMVAALCLLLGISIITQYQSVTKLNNERAAAQQANREAWLKQSPKNPHSGAHYGNFAFRLKTPLSLFDGGLDTYTGTYVFMEPHKQDDFKFSPAEDSTSLIRFGELTPAFILQTVLPLLILFLCFSAVTKEREDGTLKMLVSQGLNLPQVVAGKALGYWVAIAVPVTLLSVICLTAMPRNGIGGGNLLAQSILLVAIYILYTAFITVVCVVVSAWSNTGRAALMKLLCFWLIACIILPKVCSNVGSTLYKTPSQQEFAEQVKADEKNGLNGHDPSDKRREGLLQATLKKYGVDTVTKLPVNFDAIAMMESEKYTTNVYRKRIAQVQDIFQKQAGISHAAAFINPFQSVQYLSTALCGTDYAHFSHFQKQAEDYRLYFVNAMNGFMATHTKSGDWKTKFGPDTYKIVTPFTYKEASLGWTLKEAILFFVAFLLWTIWCTLLVLRTNKINLA